MSTNPVAVPKSELMLGSDILAAALALTFAPTLAAPLASDTPTPAPTLEPEPTVTPATLTLISSFTPAVKLIGDQDEFALVADCSIFYALISFECHLNYLINSIAAERIQITTEAYTDHSNSGSTQIFVRTNWFGSSEITPRILF
ncbi:MAG TPA: hypothetical protein VMJ32_01835 [Pirellulales bacterium]|nr:hypothetical protein [Pirellulales bacterium]